MSADLSVVVEKVVPGGRGFARLPDHRPVLIAGAFPGERVRLCMVRDRASYVEATGQLLGDGPERVEPACSVADACGGCDWMPLELSAQRSYKLDLVREALRRTGGFDQVPELQMASAGEPWAYRSRIRLQIHGGRVGFHAAGGHDLIEPKTCLVSAPELSEALGVLRGHLGSAGPAADVFSHVEVRRAPGAQRTSLYFALRRGRVLSRASRRILTDLEPQFLVRAEGEPVGTVERFDLDECYVLAAPGSFTQVNWAVNRALVRAVASGAQERGARSFADLYCGSGNFSLPLAARGLKGRGVEASDLAITAARQAAREQALAGVHFETGDVTRVARRWADAGDRYDLVVVDPPRAGAKEALEAIARLAARAVAMVSCDPVTLARDLRGLADRGLLVEKVVAFDMFPQTHHVECLAWLARGR